MTITTLIDIEFADRVLPAGSTGERQVDDDPYFYLVDFGEPGIWRFVDKSVTTTPIDPEMHR